MKPEIKALWVADLKNPENKQGHHTLRNDTGDCCLGRLCEVFRVQTGRGKWVDGEYNPRGHQIGQTKIFKVEVGEHSALSSDRDDIQLPWSVADWAGISGCNPVVRVPKDTELPTSRLRDTLRSQDGATSLSNLNDGGLTFNQIAAVIDQAL